MIVIYCSGFCPALFFIMYRLYCFAVQIPGGTTEREVKPLFFVFCSFILRCIADDFCRLVALADYVLCASPQPYLQAQQPLATLYIASLKNRCVTAALLTKSWLSRYDSYLLLGLLPCAFFIMYRLYCFAVQILGGTTEREVNASLFFVYTHISGAPGLGSKWTKRIRWQKNQNQKIGSDYCCFSR